MSKDRTLRKTTEDYKKEVFDAVGNEYTILGEYKGYNEKILMRHNTCGREFEMSPNRFISCGRRCNRCKSKDKRKKDFEDKLNKLYEGRYSLIGDYTTVNSLVKLKCNCCNTEFERYANVIINSTYAKNNPVLCHKCNNKKNRNVKHTLESINDTIKNYTDEYELINYTTYQDESKVKHKTCNTVFKITPDNLIHKLKMGEPICPKCNHKVHPSYTTEKLISKIMNETNKEYFFIDEYKNDNKKKYKFLHAKCGHIFKMSLTNFLNGHRCPHCNGGIKFTKEEVEDKLNKKFNGKYSLASDYKGVNDFTTLRCNDCGTEFETRLSNVFSDKSRMCPKCDITYGISNNEKELLSYIKKIYKGKIIENCRTVLENGKELDIYLPEINTAFEYDGLYWHSEDFVGKRYHLEKSQECELNGINLIHIFEDEWINKKPIVKDKIKNIIKCTSKKIYARECIVKEISPKDKDAFLEKNHIQGKDISKIKLGLYTNTKYYDEEVLVAVMTFCKPRKALGQSKDSIYDYELSRYAGLLNYSIIGGFSKLLKYFERNYEWNKIITYADIRWSSNGNVYLVNGFQRIRNSEPSYWYFNNNKCIREYRYKYRKTALKDLFPSIYDDNKTEYQIMKEAGFYRIWDCGNFVFEYTKKKV